METPTVRHVTTRALLSRVPRASDLARLARSLRFAGSGSRFLSGRSTGGWRRAGRARLCWLRTGSTSC
jgi:hypothetical protein